MPDPTDETQPHPRPDPSAPGSGNDPSAPGSGPLPSAPGPGPSPSEPPISGPSEPPAPGPTLRADPDRPADSGWREPAWFPPRDDGSRPRDRRSGTVAIVVGLILIAIGAWYFIDGTLGIALPRIRWASLWPVVLIVIGGLILLRSIRRKA